MPDDRGKMKGSKHVAYCHSIEINLKSFTELREYQAEALNAVAKVDGESTNAKSGYIVLPCGAGKTLLGISILCKIKK
jgi:DNA excision repair protein ERCC-3